MPKQMKRPPSPWERPADGFVDGTSRAEVERRLDAARAEALCAYRRFVAEQDSTRPDFSAPRRPEGRQSD